MTPTSIVYNIDCMEYMKSVPDKYFDLAVCDPPYGIRIKVSIGRRKDKAHSGRKKAYLARASRLVLPENVPA